MLVGLTGGIASGKSTVGGLLREAGMAVIDADRVGHELLANGAGAVGRELAAEFGPGVLSSDGSIDRSSLAALVFGDPVRLAVLERTLHPAIEAEVQRKVGELLTEHPTVVLEVPLLFEAGWEEKVDLIVVVDCAPEAQIERFMERSGATREDALARLRNQMGREERLARADLVIDNSGGLAELRPQVKALISRLKRGEQ